MCLYMCYDYFSIYVVSEEATSSADAATVNRTEIGGTGTSSISEDGDTMLNSSPSYVIEGEHHAVVHQGEHSAINFNNNVTFGTLMMLIVQVMQHYYFN